VIPSNNSHHVPTIPTATSRTTAKNLSYSIKIAVALFGLSIALTRVDGGIAIQKPGRKAFISFDDPISRVAIAGTGVIDANWAAPLIQQGVPGVSDADDWPTPKASHLPA